MNNAFNERSKEILIGITGIFAYLFFNFASGYIFSAFGINTSTLTKRQAVLISMFISFIVLAILLFISRKVLKKNIKDYKVNWKKYLKRNAKYWLCSVLIMGACNLAISLIFNRLTSANDQSIRDLFNILPVYIFLEAAFLAPITEELVFRQSFKYIFKNKYVFIISSGLIFGFMHTIVSLASLADFLYIIPYSIPGCFFAYMLYKENNILVPMTFHIIHNSLALILLIISNLIGV